MPLKKQLSACFFCAEKKDTITFRDSEILRHFVSGQHKILPRKKTGTCAKHQRRLAREIKRARELALLGYRGQ